MAHNCCVTAIPDRDQKRSTKMRCSLKIEKENSAQRKQHKINNTKKKLRIV